MRYEPSGTATLYFPIESVPVPATHSQQNPALRSTPTYTFSSGAPPVSAVTAPLIVCPVASVAFLPVMFALVTVMGVAVSKFDAKSDAPLHHAPSALPPCGKNSSLQLLPRVTGSTTAPMGSVRTPATHSPQ